MQSSRIVQPIVIAIDGTSARGKSTNAKIVGKSVGYVYVDTGAMYRTLAWYCLKKKIDVHDAKAVGNACKKWNARLDCVEEKVPDQFARHAHIGRLLRIFPFYPDLPIRNRSAEQ